MPLYLGTHEIPRIDVMKRLTLDNISLEEKTVSPAVQTLTYTPSAAYDAFSKFTVNGAPLQSKTIQPTESTQTITADSGNYGLSQVTVKAMKLGNKTITSNGTYIASSDGFDGYKQVVVDIGAIKPIIANDGSITPTGTYATSAYYNIEYGVKIGYMVDGGVMLSMRGGTSTAYENLSFNALSVPSGVTLIKQEKFSSSQVAEALYVCIINGLTKEATLSIGMNTRNATSDYIQCDITIEYV